MVHIQQKLQNVVYGLLVFIIPLLKSHSDVLRKRMELIKFWEFSL